MKFRGEVKVSHVTTRDYKKYNKIFEPQDFVRIHESDLADLIRRVNDYSHFAQTYGNVSGTCETGYPQHQGYVCGLCGQDRSQERKCLRKVQNDDQVQ